MTARKAWFRVASSIMREGWTPEERGIIVGLLAVWSDIWARDGLEGEAAHSITFGPGVLAEITGRSTFRFGVDSLRIALQSTSGSVSIEGRSVTVTWKKVSDFNGWTSRAGPRAGPSAPAPAHAPAQAQKKEEEPPKPPKGVPACWPLIVEAFAAYGKEVRTCGAARLRAVRARAREFGEASVVEAVHGYMALHRRRDDERFDPLQYLTPETIYRPSHFAKYLDAYRAATAAGETPPFTGGHDPYAAAAADFRARRHRATH